MCKRIFFSMCKLKSKSNDNLVLVAILRTLCCTPVYHVLIYDLFSNRLSKHDDGILKVLNNFWCDIDYQFSLDELKKIKNERFRLFDSSRWFYDESRCIPRDTRNPGNNLYKQTILLHHLSPPHKYFGISSRDVVCREF